MGRSKSLLASILPSLISNFSAETQSDKCSQNFLDQELISYTYRIFVVVLPLVGATSSKSYKAPSFQIRSE